jgi:hypothetical protein
MNEKQKNKPGQGRPFKMKVWIEKLEEVLDENNAVYLTDEDLVFLVNDKIDDEKFHITSRTLRNWKSGKAPDEETGKQFLRLFQKALIKQKKALFEKLESTENVTWTRLAWILERRFSEWNLKSISEIKNTNENIIQITAANLEQANLIDNIINADFVEIPLKRIELKPSK